MHATCSLKHSVDITIKRCSRLPAARADVCPHRPMCLSLMVVLRTHDKHPHRCSGGDPNSHRLRQTHFVNAMRSSLTEKHTQAGI